MIMVIKSQNVKILSSLLHGYHIPHLQSMYIPTMAFWSYNFKIFTGLLHQLFRNDNFSFYFLCIFLEIGRNYIMSIMSIIITIVSNNTVFVSQNNIFSVFFMAMSHSVIKKAPPSASPTSISPITFSPGLFVALQEMFHQPSIAVTWLFAKDNAFSKEIIFFLLAYFWSVLMLLFCFICFTLFSTVLPLWNYESKSVVVFMVPKETKFEFDNTSLILSYLYLLGNVKKELCRYYHIPAY